MAQEHTAALLPNADLVFLADPDSEESQISVAWDDVVPFAGDLMLDTGTFPHRWYVSGFPSAEQLKGMGAKAV